VTDLMPTNRTCLVFRGTSQIPQTQLGEGWRCIGEPLLRFDVQDSGPSGVAVLGPGIAALTAGGSAPIQAGQTWYFQNWYRDPGSPCGHDTNVSNGYRVDFTP
jgi:hypothetical protein